MEGLSSSFSCSRASCLSMDGELQEPGCPWGCTETGQEAAGRREYRVRKTGQCILSDEGWYGPGNGCVEKLWDPSNVKICLNRAAENLAYC